MDCCAGRLQPAIPNDCADRDRVRQSVVDAADLYLANVETSPWA